MMIHRLFVGLLLGALVLPLAGCGGGTKRMGPDEASDIEQGTTMTSQEFRSITQRMARRLVIVPQIQNAQTPPSCTRRTPPT